MSDLLLVTRAAHYAAMAHRRHRRKDAAATPYINHLTEVAQLLAGAGCAAPVISAGYLHDAIEDVDITYEMLAGEFGSEIADLVLTVTDDKSLPWQLRKELQVEHAVHASPGTAAIKLADKISNLRSLAVAPPDGWPQHRLAGYVHWAQRVVNQLPPFHPALRHEFEIAYLVARDLFGEPRQVSAQRTAPNQE